MSRLPERARAMPINSCCVNGMSGRQVLLFPSHTPQASTVPLQRKHSQFSFAGSMNSPPHLPPHTPQ